MRNTHAALLERGLEKKVCKYAADRGWHSIKLAGPGDRGKPDRLFYTTGGRVKFVEMKTKYGRLTKLQERALGTLQALGFDVHVIRDLAQAAEVFGE